MPLTDDSLPCSPQRIIGLSPEPVERRSSFPPLSAILSNFCEFCPVMVHSINWLSYCRQPQRSSVSFFCLCFMFRWHRPSSGINNKWLWNPKTKCVYIDEDYNGLHNLWDLTNVNDICAFYFWVLKVLHCIILSISVYSFEVFRPSYYPCLPCVQPSSSSVIY